MRTVETILAGAPMGNRNAAGHNQHVMSLAQSNATRRADRYSKRADEDVDNLSRHDDAYMEHKDAASEYSRGSELHRYHLAKMKHHDAHMKRLEAKTRISASEPLTTDIIHCACAVSELIVTAGQPWVQDQETSFMYMPAGRHTIIAGFRGKAIELTVEIVPEDAAKVLSASMEQLQASQPKQRLFGCIEHAEKDASVWAKKFEARPDGVYLCAEPSKLGADHVNGRIHRSWSPSFLTDADYAKARLVSDVYQFPDGVKGSKSNPAKITGCAFCLGTLTNKPAFREMSPVMAREAVDAVVMATGTSEGAKKGWESRHKVSSNNWRVYGQDEAELAANSSSEALAHRVLMHHSHYKGANERQRKAAIQELIHRGQADLDVATELASKFKASSANIPDPRLVEMAAANAVYKAQYLLDEESDGVVVRADTGPTPFNPQPFLDFLSQLRLAHWAADTSTEEHETLGELYEALEPLVDEFVEQSLGAEGTTIPSAPSLSELLENGCTLVQAELDRAPSEGVKNTLAEMCGALDKARYLLKAKDQEMKDTVQATWSPQARAAAAEARRARALSEMGHPDWDEADQRIEKASKRAFDFSASLTPDSSKRDHRKAALLHGDAAMHIEGAGLGSKDPRLAKHVQSLQRHADKAGLDPYEWGSDSLEEKMASWKSASISASTPPTATDILRATWSPQARAAALEARHAHSLGLHGFEESGGGKDFVTYTHPDHPDHHVNVHSDGHWEHHNTASLAKAEKEGGSGRAYRDNARGHGDSPGSLMTHLSRHFRNHNSLVRTSTPPIATDVLRATWSDAARQAAALSRKAHAASAEASEGHEDFSLHRAATEAHQEAAAAHRGVYRSASNWTKENSDYHQTQAKIHDTMANHHADLAEHYDQPKYTGAEPPTATSILKAISPHSGANGQPAV